MFVQDISPIPVDAFLGRAHQDTGDSGVVPLDLSEYLGTDLPLFPQCGSSH